MSAWMAIARRMRAAASRREPGATPDMRRYSSMVSRSVTLNTKSRPQTEVMRGSSVATSSRDQRPGP